MTEKEMKMVIEYIKAKNLTEKITRLEKKQEKLRQAVKKYHLSEKGKIARREASRRYYQKKKLAKLANVSISAN
jgi:hypothetical protein